MNINININETLTRGVQKILPSKEALASLMAKKKITLYQGFDPSTPSLHLGNYVGLMKLRAFQKLGHKVIFLVGDFTGMIGDPTDKLASRKMLTREEILKNAKSYKDQAGRILDFSGTNPAQIKFNSSWLDKVSFKDLVEITSNFTVQQMIERDMFQERLKKEKPIHLHEFLYPVAQGIDCVEMNVDLEIGGNDQIFNMLAGRTLMKTTRGKEKFVLATKLLVDKEGSKIGKTTGKALFLDSTPENFFSGIMSFPDEVIELGFELLTEVDLKGLGKKISEEPMSQKKKLAYEIVKMLWGEVRAKKAKAEFEKTFQKRGVPAEITTVLLKDVSLPLLDLVFSSRLVKSRAEAKRLILQKAIEVNGEVLSEPASEIKIGREDFVVKIGKTRFVKFRRQ